MKRILLLVLLSLFWFTGYSQLNITNALTPTQLVQNVLLGTGVTVSNVTYNGSANSRGSFTCAGACNLGVGNGVFLTTGNTNSPFAPASFHHSNGMNTPGDPNLDAIVSPLLTEDAAVLEFDFWVAADSVQFNYVFGSEEYNDYVNTPFNDVFGFFISGPGIVGQKNIALVPNTTTPVAINNVNNGGPFGGVSAGPCNNCAYFVDNIGGGSVFLDAFTTVLTAKSAVYPCETYHIKLAIADVNDGIFDSGVFLEANSFSSLGQIAIFADGQAQQNNAVVNACTGDSVELCLNPSSSYSWSTGATTQCIWVSEQNINATGIYSGAVSNGTGCFAFTANIQVQFVTPTATITPSGPTSLCPGSTVTLNANSGNSYLWSTGATTQSITVGTGGSYTVTVFAGPSCSAISTPVNVTVGNASAQITGTTSLCNGAATVLSANAGQSYLWNSGATTQNINVSTAGSYTVTVTQAGGCTATATANVQVNANPAPSITGILAICQGQSTTLDGGAGYSAYLWNTGATTQTLSVATSGTYTVTVTDINGCVGSANTAVVVSNNPVPNITGVLSFCSGSSTIINGGPGFSSYLWNTGATTANLIVTAGGNYTVTVTNAAGCTGIANTSVTMNPLPLPNITGPTSICQGQSSSLNAGGGFASYQWNNGATTQTVSVNSTGIYTVTVTNAFGCSNTDNQAVSVNPLPAPAVTGVNEICAGSNTIFDAGPGFNSYLWNTGAVTQTITAASAGTYTVTVTNIFGCSASATRTLTVNPNPIPVITGNNSICQGQSTLINAGGGYASYLWNNGMSSQFLSVNATGNYVVTVTDNKGCVGSASQLVTVHNLPTPAITGIKDICAGSAASLNAGGGYSGYLWNNGATTQVITPSSAGTFTVTVTDVNGCIGSASSAVTVNPLPIPAITGNLTICQGETTTLDAGAGYASYLWSNGAVSQTLNTGQPGPFTVTVTDINGCSASAATGITVHALPTPSILGNTAFCQGLSSNLNAGGGFITYLWNTGAATQNISVNTGGPYSVTVTDINGCSGSTSQLITVHALPAPSISGNNNICIGDVSALNAGGGYAGYVWNTGATTQTINTSNAGAYTVTVTNVNGCTGTTNTSVVVNPLPTPLITGVMEICQGQSTPLDAGAGYSAYLWSNGATTQSINANGVGPFTVTVTDGNGCSAPATASVVVNPLPSPSITGVTSFCQGESSVLNAGNGFNSYLWSSGATSSTITVTNAGSYTVTVTDNKGCQGTTNQNITVNALPIPVISGGPDICQGDTEVLNAGGGYASYTWSNGATTQTISVGSAGSYTVSVTTAAGCSGSTTTSIVVNPLPVPSITGIVEVCQGALANFDAGAGYNSYQWSNGATTQTISPGAAGIYTVTVTDANGCSNTDDISLTVNPLPTPSITGVLKFCDGESSNLNAGSGYNSYQWSNGSTASTINVSAAGSYSVTVTDAKGCEGSTTASIVVDPLPVPVISGQTAICDGTTSVFDAGAGYMSYVWSNGATSQSIQINTAGQYQVTVTDINGCVGSVTEDLIVHVLPTAAITGTTAICFGEQATLEFPLTGTSPFTFVYSANGVNMPPVTTSSSPYLLNVSPGSSATYTLVSISDANCQGSIAGSALITVNPLPEPAITGDLEVCDGENSLLTTTNGFTQYLWSTGESTSSISVNTTGFYTVTVKDGNGCSGTSPNVSFVVHDLPVVSFTNDTSITCEVPYVNFKNTSVFDPGSTFNWQFGDGTVAYVSDPSHLFAQPGTYDVTLIVTTPAGCVSQASHPVSVVFYPLPVADFIAAPSVATVFNSKIEFVDRSQYAVSWHWSFGDGDFDDNQNTEHYFNDVGDYRVSLKVTNIAGCEDTHTEVVAINPFYIPNAFTPNGDGINDYFFDSGYDLDITSYRMTIFSRWGEEVFVSPSINNMWDGTTPNGSQAPQGTYVYKMEVTTKGGKKHTFTGQVNLIR